MPCDLYEEMLRAVQQCKWKHNVCNIDICTLACSPCQAEVESGRCVILIELVKTHNANPSESEETNHE